MQGPDHPIGILSRPDMSAGFSDFDSGHRDLVTVTKFNFYGNRIVTASSDHRMKVWDQKDGEWQLTDTWRAHDAEIRDVSRACYHPLVSFGFLTSVGNLEWAFYWPAYWQCG